MNLSIFVQDFARMLKKKARASKDKRFQGKNQKCLKSCFLPKAMFGLIIKSIFGFKLPLFTL